MSKRTHSQSFPSAFNPQPLNGRTHWSPTRGSSNSHHSNFFLAHHDASATVDEWTGGERAGGAGPTAGNRTGRGRGREGREETVQTEVLGGHPSNLQSTLQHIVQQLDILTQTVSVLEERLTITEDKVKECLHHQSQIIRDMQASEERRRTDSEDTDGSADHFT
ncbi:unnamed protein product [Ophioblennius macclurei]